MDLRHHHDTWYYFHVLCPFLSIFVHWTVPSIFFYYILNGFSWLYQWLYIVMKALSNAIWSGELLYPVGHSMSFLWLLIYSLPFYILVIKSFQLFPVFYHQCRLLVIHYHHHFSLFLFWVGLNLVLPFIGGFCFLWYCFFSSISFYVVGCYWYFLSHTCVPNS